MRIYQFERGLAIIREYQDEGMPCEVTEVTEQGSKDMTLNNFDLECYIDDCEISYGQLLSTQFLKQ